MKTSSISFVLACGLLAPLSDRIQAAEVSRGSDGHPADNSEQSVDHLTAEAADSNGPEDAEEQGRFLEELLAELDGGSNDLTEQHESDEAEEADSSEGRRDQGHRREVPPGRLKKLKAAGSSAGVSRGDFNGDGIADLAVGVPSEDIVLTLINPLTGQVTTVTSADAGAVNVIYGSAGGLTTGSTGIPANQFWSQNSAGMVDISETSDRFGAALASGDFNGDGFSDLAIAVPGESTAIPGTTTSVWGALQILYGSSQGLTSANNQFLRADQLFSAGPSGGFPQVGDSLVWGDFNGDGFGDLGVEGRPLSISDLPAVSILFGSAGGLNQGAIPRQQLRIQNASTPLEGGLLSDLSLAAGDFNGDAFADLAVGTPNATVSLVANAGAVQVFAGTSTGITEVGKQTFHQDVVGVAEAAEAGDEFGFALAAGDFNHDGFVDLAVGVPFEDVDRAFMTETGVIIIANPSDTNAMTDAGVVQVFFGSGPSLTAARGGLAIAGNQLIVQHPLVTTEGFFPRADAHTEPFDNFGAALAAGDFNGDGFRDLAVGSPNDRLGSAGTTGGIARAGSVNVYSGSSTGLELWNFRFFNEGNLGIGVTPAAGDRFGAALTAWNFGRNLIISGVPPRAVVTADLAIGVPGKDVNGRVDAGLVRVLYGDESGLSTASGLLTGGLPQTWHQDVSGILDACEAGDRFGDAMY